MANRRITRVIKKRGPSGTPPRQDVLPSRALLQGRLEHALEHAKRRGRHVAVLFIGLDDFKGINHSLGHAAGDQVLDEVARRLGARIRKEDTLGCLGGDKFLLLLEHLHEAHEAAQVARDLQAALRPVFVLADGHEVYQDASIGISLFPEDSGTAADLIRDAETAMYQAKDRGHGQFCFHTGDMNARALASLELESDLRRALEREELELHFQPKVDLHDGRIASAEALLRWRCKGTQVSPVSFIPVAEKSGLIVPIGAWVIDSACARLRAWADQGHDAMRLAVNVSARQFHAGNLEALVSQAVARHGIHPANLELELTESTLMEDPEATHAMLRRLKDIGVKLALDDFGTGYSSFAYLSRFPIDTLKVDQSFVRHLVTEARYASIIAAIIGLAHKLGLKVVAEGVEDQAQLASLRKLGCDEIQGFLFSRAVPEAEYLALLRQGKALPGQPAPPEGERTLLLVDDDPGNLSALRRMLRHEGYRILTASDATEGMERLALENVQVVISDQRMPGLSGTEFLTRVKEMYPDCMRIILSGQADMESVLGAINDGAVYKFFTKPWDDMQLRERIREAFRAQAALSSTRNAPP